MTTIHTRGRLALAGAAEWWNDHAWPNYDERCEAP
jgi:hypothetical protein